MEVGFTGTREGMNAAQYDTFVNLLLDLEGEVFHHGDCVGADEEAAAAAKGVGYGVIGHPPADHRLRAFFESDENFKPKPYLVRNADIVRLSDVVVATPATEEGAGSRGTWWTINHAIAQGVPVTIIHRNGELEHR